jgi:hypothetical protein
VAEDLGLGAGFLCRFAFCSHVSLPNDVVMIIKKQTNECAGVILTRLNLAQFPGE